MSKGKYAKIKTIVYYLKQNRKPIAFKPIKEFVRADGPDGSLSPDSIREAHDLIPGFCMESEQRSSLKALNKKKSRN